MPAPRPMKSTIPGRSATVMPMANAPESEANDVLLTRPHAHAPKPTLWQRIWYGRNAEAKLLHAEIAKPAANPVENPLAEVKAGVLNEMRNISATKGGVAGSPFANVVLPQAAKASAKTSVKTETVVKTQTNRRLWVWVWVVAALLGLGYLIMQRAAQVGQSQAPVLAPPTEFAEETVKPTGAAADPALAPAPAVANQPATAPVDLLAAKVKPLTVSQLNQMLRPGTPKSTVVANRPGDLLVSSGLTNIGTKPMQNIMLQLEIDDMANQPLLRRVVQVVGPVEPGRSLPATVLTLAKVGNERFVAMASLSAFKVRFIPLRGEMLE